VNLSDHKKYWDNKAIDRCRNVDGNIELRGDPKKWNFISDLLSEYITQNDRVLEIGGGSGAIAVKVFNKLKGIHYVNMDISEVFASFVGNTFGIPSTVGDAKQLPFKDNIFDAVWCLDVLEHLYPPDRIETYKEIGRVLKNDGAIFINNPTYKSKHDQNFEWLFDDSKLLFETLNEWRIHQKMTYAIDTAISEFIVLTRN